MVRIDSNFSAPETCQYKGSEWEKGFSNVTNFPKEISNSQDSKDVASEQFNKTNDHCARIHAWNRAVCHVQKKITALQLTGESIREISSLLADFRNDLLSLNDGASLDSLRVNNSLRQIDAAIARVSSRRASLENKTNSLKKTLEQLYTTDESAHAGKSLERHADLIRHSINTVKTQISRETNTALLAQSNLQQQRVLHLLYSAGE